MLKQKKYGMRNLFETEDLIRSSSWSCTDPGASVKTNKKTYLAVYADGNGASPTGCS